MLSSLEIARAATLVPIQHVAAKLGIAEADLELYGKYKAKIALDLFPRLSGRQTGKLVLVSAMNPTPPGEGKTTTTVGLGDALNRIGKKATICLREPSLGPCFGMKGGAAGGGRAQVVPMEDINLHFTGDFHAVGLAHNLLAAMIDNHLHHGNALDIEPRRIVWRRVMDMNDRALREIVVGLGGAGNSIPRETGFDITAASEVMAILCLSETLAELKDRLGRIVVAYTHDGHPVTARTLHAQGAMTALLKDALKPNLVQTLEGNPALIHGGPFANIAHGCSSVLATKLALRLSEYTVTEAGFGADLGAEKFLDIKCRQAKIAPDVVVLVATVRAIKYHGGAAPGTLDQENAAALEKGVENLKKHIENIHAFGLPVVVAINSFASDREEEVRFIRDQCDYLTVKIVTARHFAEGGKGAEELAHAVVDLAERVRRNFKHLYPDEMPLYEKVRTIAQKIYGATDIIAEKKLQAKFAALEEAGYGTLPVCIAKTQYSLSTDPGLRGRPKDFEIPLADVRLSAGAGFVVVLTGDIMTMPGLPSVPSAVNIDVDEKGNIVGLF